MGDKSTFRANPNMILCTHLNVVVVSEAFRGLSHTDRAALVYEALIDDFFENPGTTDTTSTDIEPLNHRSLPKNFCIHGPAVNDLPNFKHLTALPFEMMLDLRTPAQYDPLHNLPSESERNAKSRTGVTALGINQRVKTPSKIKSLRSIMKIPSEKNRNAGGMHSHFFHDMPKDVKQLVLEEYVASEASEL